MGIKVKGISQAKKSLNALVGDIQGERSSEPCNQL